MMNIVGSQTTQITDLQWCQFSQAGNREFEKGDYAEAEALYLQALVRIQNSITRYWITQTDYHWPAMLIVSSANYARALIQQRRNTQAVQALSEAAFIIQRTLMSRNTSVTAKEGCALHAPRMLGQVITLSSDWPDLRYQMSEPLHALKHSCRNYWEQRSTPFRAT